MAITITISGAERERRLGEANNQRFFSAHGLLNEHNGWRDSKLHLFIGPTGAGKSTLTRSLLLDCLVGTNNKFIAGLWLSEETTSEFITEINHVKIPDHIGDRVVVESEQEMEFKTCNNWLLSLKSFIEKNNLDILFLDNITTSIFYNDADSKEQARIARALKKLAQIMDIPIVILAHTSAEITETYPRMINLENIRGSKNLTNMVEFAYIIQPFFHHGEKHVFIRIAKHRGQDVQNRIFKFYYYCNQKIYGKSEPKPFDQFKELFNKREKL
jgi:energy-coupling factor transporter ATP-binding protein EcfA2